jgi:16S rRNA (cytosine1402-N4)-methyltransferase
MNISDATPDCRPPEPAPAEQGNGRAWPHLPVMAGPVVELLREMQRPPRVVLDGTVGLGGHAEALLRARGAEIELYLGLDRDADALELARERLCGPAGPARRGQVLLKQANFTSLRDSLQDEGLETADFLLLDLGVSTYQLKTASRGFSLAQEGPLDMRMDSRHGTTARELLQRASRAEIESWLREFGEAPFAGRIARVLHERRANLLYTTDVTAAVLDAIPGPARRTRPGEIHPATQVFQALRIAVNQELDNLDDVLPEALDCLSPGGRLAVISFHSLEDRRVKRALETAARDCVCPPRMPACGCGHRAAVRLLHRGAVKTSQEEASANPASRSARLRAAERIAPPARQPAASTTR